MSEPRLRRSILVPIDLHGVNRHTLETLVRIARQLDRSLLGLLLEDIHLQQVADLPFTTEITLGSGRERSLVRDHLSQRHNLIRSDARRQLNDLATSNQVELQFEDAAGARWTAVLERDGHQDIFLPPRARWHTQPHVPAGKRQPIKRMGVVLPPGEPDTRVLAAAAALIKADLVGDIYILSRVPPVPEDLHDLYRTGHQVRLQSNFHCSTQSLSALIHRCPYDLLILPGECLREIPATQLEAVLDESPSQVLIIN